MGGLLCVHVSWSISEEWRWLTAGPSGMHWQRHWGHLSASVCPSLCPSVCLGVSVSVWLAVCLCVRLVILSRALSSAFNAITRCRVASRDWLANASLALCVVARRGDVWRIDYVTSSYLAIAQCRCAPELLLYYVILAVARGAPTDEHCAVINVFIDLINTT